MTKLSARYIQVCRDLGFIPEVEFVKIHPGGAIGFTAGKPDEIRALAAAATAHGYKLSKGLRDALTRC